MGNYNNCYRCYSAQECLRECDTTWDVQIDRFVRGPWNKCQEACNAKHSGARSSSQRCAIYKYGRCVCAYGCDNTRNGDVNPFQVTSIIYIYHDNNNNKIVIFC